MPRSGLNPTVIARVAAALVDNEGPAALSLARVADELGVRPPSLYSHVDGLAALERLVALDGIERLAGACRDALLGRSGADGLRAMANAYRAFAHTHPGVYQLAQVARPADAEYEQRASRLLEAVFAVLSGLGVQDSDLVHAARTVRSTLHGFVALETQAGFSLDVDLDESFTWSLAAMERSLATMPAS